MLRKFLPAGLKSAYAHGRNFEDISVLEKPDGWLAGWWLVFGKAVEINRVLPNKYVTYRH